MSVELLFLINQAADLSIIAAVSRGFGAFRLRRAWLSSVLCALYGVLAAVRPGLAAPGVQLGLLMPAAMLALGRASPARAAPSAAARAAPTLVTGCCAERCGHLAGLCVLAAPTACALTLRSQRMRAACPFAEIEVRNRGATARFAACVDTGNRLTEPFSGQPVLIASQKLLRRVLPEAGFRRVAYGSVGGGGTLRCFRPERIYIDRNGRRLRAPDAWIAVYPERLPGPAQALAPAAFITY